MTTNTFPKVENGTTKYFIKPLMTHDEMIAVIQHYKDGGNQE